MLERKLLLLLALSFPLAAGTLSVRIQDGPARVYLTNLQSVAFFPENTIAYNKPGEQNFVPRANAFSIDLPQGTYTLTVERGKEYLPQTLKIAIPASGERKFQIRLHRFLDMARRGWYSGDMHVHRPLSDIAPLMAAEDLAFAVPITRWKTNQKQNEDPDLPRFLAASDNNGISQAAPGRYFSVLNEELEPRASALLASALAKTPVPLDYPLASFGEAVANANGLSDSEKPTSLELPALAALQAFETLGLVNNHIWRTAAYTAPWGAWPTRMTREYPNTCAGFVQSGFEMYSALLNAGFSFKLSAGSASGVHPVPPGWSRVYVHTDGPMSARAWYQGLRAGHSFITTGPMLFLKVNGQEPGSTLLNQTTVHATVEMLSSRPVAQAEIVINGQVHAVPLTKSGRYSYRGSLTLALEASSWIAARWLEPRGNTCDAAHTSPVNVMREAQPIPLSRPDLTMLLNRVNQLIADVASNGDLKGQIALDPPELRRATLGLFQRARQFYLDKLGSLKTQNRL